jgi:small subunit ribosomal protein S16
MVLRIRLSRFGRANQPLYNIVLTRARTARDSKPLEVLGTYDPTPRVPLATDDEPKDAVDAAAAVQAVGGTGKKKKMTKDIALDISRTRYWLGVGAQPSEPVWRLLSLVSAECGVIELNEGMRANRSVCV